MNISRAFCSLAILFALISVHSVLYIEASSNENTDFQDSGDLRLLAEVAATILENESCDSLEPKVEQCVVAPEMRSTKNAYHGMIKRDGIKEMKNRKKKLPDPIYLSSSRLTEDFDREIIKKHGRRKTYQLTHATQKPLRNLIDMNNKEWIEEMKNKKKKLPDPNYPSSSRLPEDFDREIINNCGRTETYQRTHGIQKPLRNLIDMSYKEWIEEMKNRKKKLPDPNYPSSSRLPKDFDREIINNCGRTETYQRTHGIQKPLRNLIDMSYKEWIEEMKNRKKKLLDPNCPSSSRLPEDFDREIINNCGRTETYQRTHGIQKPLRNLIDMSYKEWIEEMKNRKKKLLDPNCPSSSRLPEDFDREIINNCGRTETYQRTHGIQKPLRNLIDMSYKEWIEEMKNRKKKLLDPNCPSSSRLPEDFDRKIINNRGGRKTNQLTRAIQKLVRNSKHDKERSEAMQSRKKKLHDLNYPSSSRLPKEFERKIIKNCGGIKPKSITRVIQKPLTYSDLVKSNNKVTMPYRQAESFKFLKKEERKNLKDGKPIEVLLIHKSRKNGIIETKLKLKQRNPGKKSESPQYALRTGWNKVVSDDELEEGDMVQIWAYRNALNMMLCLVLVKIESDEEGQQPTTEESNDGP